jgi:hypothetical protein
MKFHLYFLHLYLVWINLVQDMSIKIYSLVVSCAKSGGEVNTKLYLVFLTSGRFILMFLMILLNGGQ